MTYKPTLFLALLLVGCAKVQTCKDGTHTSNGYCNVYGHPAQGWTGSDEAIDVIPYLIGAQLVCILGAGICALTIRMNRGPK